ncbi:hypothetical protein [Cytobacillus solani]|uniref:hypothetical protein n=1 Tax=Cytobacillus solani TaxID=1637975 RepID=UPI000A88DDC6|nr:hypothetical protein [Cytobacillus solani]
MTKFKTVKRKANVGERILITKVSPSESGRYKTGDIGVVQSSASNVIAIINGKPDVLIFDYEYEVIVENKTEASEVYTIEARYEKAVEQAREAIEELRLASLAKGYEDARRDLTAVTPVGHLAVRTPQEIRDVLTRERIIEQAKRDVAKLEGLMISPKVGDEGNNAFRNWRTVVNFVVNREKRTVVALVYSRDLQVLLERGIAKCAPTDCFNAHIGRAISLRRALGLEVPSEYLNVPQPTEVRVGDVIERTGLFECSRGLRTITKIETRKNGDKFYRTAEGPGGTDEENVVRIIDDTRENEPKAVTK